MTKLTIELTDPKSLSLLENLESLNVLKIVKDREAKAPFNGKQYRGILPKEEAIKFREHIKTIRNEWEQDI